MKKFYVLIVVCFGLIIQGFGQDYYWVGTNGSNWSSASNWSNTAGGAGGAGVPNGTAHNAFFNSDVSVNLDVSIVLNRLDVAGSNNDVTIIATGQNRSIQVTSINAATPALDIDATSSLRLGTTSTVSLTIELGTNAKGTINGTLFLDGADIDHNAVFLFPDIPGQTTKVNVNSGGRIVVEPTGFSPANLSDENYLSFNAGSKLELKNDGPFIPVADYALSSEIIITGVFNQEVTNNIASGQTIGNLTYNCPSQQESLFSPISLNFVSGAIVGGDLKIQSTNNQPLVIMSGADENSNLLIKGDLDIQGPSNIALANAIFSDQTFTITVEGDINAGGTVFDLQKSTDPDLQPTILIAKGNIQHTNGSFTAGTSVVNNSTDLFIIEMSGNGTQTISSSAGSFDNAGSQVTLKINKPTSTGLVNLLSPLAVGRLNLTSGILHATSTNYLTIQNTSGQPNVLTSTANSFVQGPLRRVIASTAEQQFATGNGSVKRTLLIKPTTTAQTIFEATLKTGTVSGAPSSPLDGIESNYYWEVNRISGTADAEITLTLVGGVSGADAGDAIVVARHDGTNWVRAGRNAVDGFIAPGDLTTGGVIRTDAQASFGAFAFGYGVQASVLPIKLESFNAKKINSSAQINWRISENSNPVSFEIMKSGDGINFSKLGTVAALEGKLNYDFADNNLLNGNNYYRLRMLDKDGIVSFSSIVVVMNGTQGVMISSMMPTMVVDRARLNITSSVNGNMQLVITDISGRVIQIQNSSIISGNQEVWLNANRLSPGIFQVTGYMNGEKTATIRFFKR